MLAAMCWLAFPPVSSAACEQAGLDDNYLTLLEVSLGDSRIILEDVIPAYRMDDGLYVPLDLLMQSLDFPITVDLDAARAEGWFLDTTRTFVLDLEDCRVSVNGREEALAPGLIDRRDDDIYVHETLIEKWFPLDLDFDPSELRLTINALEPLPLQERLERERRWERYGNTQTAADADHPPIEDTPYRFMDWPFIDATVQSHVEESASGERVSTDRYKIVAAGDFLKMNAQVSLAGSNGDVLDSFVTLGRRDPAQRLLGPLHASEFVFGDIATARDPLIANTALGRGFHVSNLPLDRPQEFDRFSLRGELPLGWDVELYRNGQLIAFQSAQSGDRYDFTDIPLDFGVNRFRLVFYGPQGQVREETLQRVIGQDMIRPGEHYYHFTAMQERDLFDAPGLEDPVLADEEEDPRFAFGYDYGVTRAFSVGTTLRRIVLDDIGQDYATAHTNLSLPGAFARVEYASQAEGGTALSTLLSTQLFGLDITAESSRFDDFDSERVRSEIVPGELRARNELRVRGRSRRLGFGMQLARNRGTEGERLEATGHLSYVTRFGTATYAYETDLTDTAAIETRRARQRLLFSTRRGPVSFRGEVVQELLPEPYVQNIGLSADWSLGDRATLRLGALRNPAEDTTTYSTGLSWRFDHFSLGMSVARTDNGDMTAGLVLSSSFSRDPVADDWRITSNSRTQFGALGVHVFLDDNGNGTWDESEPPVPDVKLRVGGVVRDKSANDSGYVYIAGIPSYEVTEVSVDPSSIENPFWQVDASKTSVVPRPGRTARIQIPVTPTGSIEGMVLARGNGDFRAVSGERVYLLTADGRRIGSTASAYDGYFYFDRIPPGFYRIRLGRAGLDRAYDPADVLIEIHGGMGTIGSVDLVIRDEKSRRSWASVSRSTRSATAEPAESLAAGSGYTIQLMAASTESVVQRYIALHGLAGNAAYVETVRNGRPWYQVLSGRYPDAATARNAIQQLPRVLKSAGPYIRPLASIEGRMNKALPMADGPRADAWILSRPDQYYTVQLMAVRSESEARDFIEEHDLGDTAAYFRTQRDGEDWYSIILGEYSSRAAANAAAAALSPEIRAGKPWIRSFESVQNSIRKR
ncbi:MAG TPA: SPOR domain-containing protein [Gammaproteobacteria bacterium]